MVTQSQQMQMTGEGTTFATSGNEPQEERMQLFRNKVLRLSGLTALSILFLFGLVLSIIFPYGIGVAVFVWIIALLGALCGAGLACFNLVKDMLGKTATFGYAPTTAYMTGKKMKKRRREESSEEEKTDKQ
ncbi:MAG: hypothetical protein HY755_09645 [Nitrospirae bacterium]|nr:hypothetical protein [Nitrospirota bacterium]